MKKLLFPLVLVLLCSFSMQKDMSSDECAQTKVWVCPGSSVYHRTSSCMEIKKCGKASLMALYAAQQQGKKACVVCYPTRSNQQTKSSSQATKTIKSTQATKTQKTTTTNNNQATKTQKSTTTQATKSQATKSKK